MKTLKAIKFLILNNILDLKERILSHFRVRQVALEKAMIFVEYQLGKKYGCGRKR